MSELHTPINDIDDGSGQVKQAYQFMCACSNNDPGDGQEMTDAFYVFWEPSNNHLHIQCFDCWQTYCPYKQCVPPPTAEIAEGR